MNERPHTHRSAVRLLVLSTAGVLLIRKHDPGCPGFAWWDTPGGGIDAGETPEVAAIRELVEETGKFITAPELEGPIATRSVRHGYSDRILTQDETFFVVRTEPFVPNSTALTERERQHFLEIRWVPAVELSELDQVWPRELPDLVTAALTHRITEPLDLGRAEESTIAIDD